jgi:hypothetical protein
VQGVHFGHGIDCGWSWNEVLKCDPQPNGVGCFYCFSGVLFQHHDNPPGWTLVNVAGNPYSDSWTLKCTQTQTPSRGSSWGILTPAAYEWQARVYHGCGCSDPCTPEGRTTNFTVP